jgi:hypothetical protein
VSVEDSVASDLSDESILGKMSAVDEVLGRSLTLIGDADEGHYTAVIGRVVRTMLASGHYTAAGCRVQDESKISDVMASTYAACVNA